MKNLPMILETPRRKQNTSKGVSGAFVLNSLKRVKSLEAFSRFFGTADGKEGRRYRVEEKQMKELFFFGQVQWHAPVVPATWEAEARESLEPGRWRLQ